MSATGPIFLLTACAQDQLAYLIDYVERQHIDDAHVRVVRGEKCRTSASLFDEWSAAMQFPPYFGANWMAFADCLGDVPRRPPPDQVLIVTHAASLLSGEPRQLPALFGALHEAAASWTQRFRDRIPTLTIILQEVPSDFAAILAILRDLDLRYDTITADWLELLASSAGSVTHGDSPVSSDPAAPPIGTEE